jgi:hypothetical protein
VHQLEYDIFQFIISCFLDFVSYNSNLAIRILPYIVVFY